MRTVSVLIRITFEGKKIIKGQFLLISFCGRRGTGVHRVEGRIQKIERWGVPKCHKRWKLLCLRSM